MTHAMTRVLVIDNYDSFTWNLVHLVAPLVEEVEVVRNDGTSVEAVRAARPDAIILSPGPCTPNEAGISLKVVEVAPAEVPVLGVCLGHQAIGQAYGGKVVRGQEPVHGKTARILHDGEGVYRGLPQGFEATRYHSLVIEPDSVPECLAVTSRTEDGVIMGVRHRELPVEGVQFHPESVLTPCGRELLKNFLEG
jgi:anthranilate synthase component II